MIEPRGMIFHNEHETNGEKWVSFSFSVSEKDQNGDWVSASMPIRFWKECQPPEDRTRIKITDGWQKPMKWGKEYKVGWFVKAYEAINKSGESGFTALVQDDLPF